MVERGSRNYGEGVIDLPLIFQWKGKPRFGKKIGGRRTDSVKMVMETRLLSYSDLPSRIDIGRHYPEQYALSNRKLGRFHFTETGRFEFLVRKKGQKSYAASMSPEANHPLFPVVRDLVGTAPVLAIDLVEEGRLLRFHQAGGSVEHAIGE